MIKSTRKKVSTKRPRSNNESLVKKKERVQLFVRLLRRYYPDAHCALDHENPLQLLIATILSAQCTDERVNIVTKGLFRSYKTAEDFANADLAELEELVRPTGFYRNKAKNIKACCQSLVDLHNGEIPRDLEAMTRLAGVGRKTANVVLGNAFNITSGIVVDTHVTRLSQRWRLTTSDNAEKIERELMELVDRKHWILFSHWLIFHGRQVCKARKPRCETCFLEDQCPQVGVD